MSAQKMEVGHNLRPATDRDRIMRAGIAHIRLGLSLCLRLWVLALDREDRINIRLTLFLGG